MSMAYGEPFGGQYGTLSDAQERWAQRHAKGTSTFDYLWRVEAVSYSTVIDAEREEYGSTAPRLELFIVSIRRWTPCGARGFNNWIDLRDGHKQFASRTPEEALRQFATRRHRQRYILERQLARAKREQDLAAAALDAIKEHA